MSQILRSNPFLSRSRLVRLPGGEADAIVIGDNIGVQLSDYRFGEVVVPFLYAGTNMRTGEPRLSFRGADGEPFTVSDAIVAHAGQIAAELASNYVEAFPDFGIRTHLNPGYRDPIPRYMDPNEDPWRSFFGYDVIERIDTELGEMVVAAGDFFCLRVGAGSSCGVSALTIDGQNYAARLDFRVEDGQVLAAPLNGSKVPTVLVQPMTGEDEMPVPAPASVTATVARVAEQAAAQFLRRNFNVIRLAIIRNLSHRNDKILAARQVLRRAMETAGPALKDFLRERYNEFEPLHADYLGMMDDLRNMTGPDEAHTAETRPDQHYVRRQVERLGIAP